jgi:hypothetical protein
MLNTTNLTCCFDYTFIEHGFYCIFVEFVVNNENINFYFQFDV